jgi:hypothetical protein
MYNALCEYSSVNKVNHYGLHDRASICYRGKDFSPYHDVQPQAVSHTTPYQVHFRVRKSETRLDTGASGGPLRTRSELRVTRNAENLLGNGVAISSTRGTRLPVVSRTVHMDPILSQLIPVHIITPFYIQQQC